ncbi:MAG: DoxX family membrane protein [Bacteroidetes bacterium]|nr:DoxX family membrane protein [Bacteroidota bacterium]
MGDGLAMCFNNTSVLFLILRVILGMLFFFQGYDKVFKLKITGVIDFFKSDVNHHKIPSFVLRSSAYVTSYIELIGGALLILGLFNNYTLYLLGFDLVIVAGALSILKPMWDLQLFFPRLLMLSILLYLPAENNLFSIDYLIHCILSH